MAWFGRKKKKLETKRWEMGFRDSQGPPTPEEKKEQEPKKDYSKKLEPQAEEEPLVLVEEHEKAENYKAQVQQKSQLKDDRKPALLKSSPVKKVMNYITENGTIYSHERVFQNGDLIEQCWKKEGVILTGAVYVPKAKYDAFREKKLEQRLKREDIRDLLIVNEKVSKDIGGRVLYQEQEKTKIRDIKQSGVVKGIYSD